MAKATAKCTCKTCGNHFYKEAYKQNRAQADSWVEWAVYYFDTCPDCEQNARRNLAAEYAKEASESGFPDLKGTEKQVIWAEQIRHDRIEEINDLVQQAISASKDETAAKIEMTMSYILTNDQSRWWIDNRDCSIERLVKTCYRKAQEAEVEKVTKKPQKEPEDNTVVTPENAQYGTVEVVVMDSKVEAHYPKDDTFRAVVKSAGFTWDPDGRCWIKKISVTTGSSIDRAADISNKLLEAGFPIKCKDADVRAKAVSGDFEPECKRWVLLRIDGNYAGWLAIKILRNDPDSQTLYDAARKIKGSKWSDGFVVVPVAQHNLLEDFCKIYGYKIAPAPAQAIKKYMDAHTISPQKLTAQE